MEIQNPIPDVQRLGGVLEKFQEVSVRRSWTEMSNPKSRRAGMAPTSGQGRDLRGLSQPNAWFASCGWSLVGEESDEASVIQRPMRCFEAVHVVVDGSPMEVPDELKEVLPEGVMGRSSHSDGVVSQDMENPRQPFPVAVVHGEEQSRDSLGGPWIAKLPKRAQVQAVPTARQKKCGLLHRALEQSTGEVGGKIRIHSSGQLQDLAFARNGQEVGECTSEKANRSLGRRRAKWKDHSTMVEMGQWSTQGEQT